MKEIQKNKKGITLIALIITIIVLLILAGVTIATLTGDNGILNQANKAKEKTELAGLKEQIELEILALNMQQKDFTSSEVIDKLVERGILKSDRTTFTNNNNYSLLTNGNILLNGNTIETIDLTNNVSSLEVKPSSSRAIGTRMIACKDGIVQYANPDTDDKENFKIIASNPPSGKKFAYWIDKYNNIVSYFPMTPLYTVVDNTYTAIYVDEKEDITKTCCINIYSTNQTQDGYLAFQSLFVGDKNTFVSLHMGTLATNNPSLATKENLIVETTNSEIYYRGSDPNNIYDSFAYYWNKSNVGNDTWYCRGYATITYNDGTTETIYTDIISEQK